MPTSAKIYPKVQKSVNKGGFHIIGATIRTHREIQYLLYAFFFVKINKSKEKLQTSLITYTYVASMNVLTNIHLRVKLKYI